MSSPCSCQVTLNASLHSGDDKTAFFLPFLILTNTVDFENYGLYTYDILSGHFLSQNETRGQLLFWCWDWGKWVACNISTRSDRETERMYDATWLFAYSDGSTCLRSKPTASALEFSSKACTGFCIKLTNKLPQAYQTYLMSCIFLCSTDWKAIFHEQSPVSLGTLMVFWTAWARGPTCTLKHCKVTILIRRRVSQQLW